MTVTFNDKLIAYLALVSGLAISGVAEYYSIMGLIAIYPTALIPIIIMGVVLGVGKISGTIWLKQNWEWSPFFLKAYVLPAIFILMMITSLGVFGFLSKAHSDQSMVSGDVLAKIAVYDEKIKLAKENIDANRKALKQLDEAVDQVMARSTSEAGADKAVQVRRSQGKERSRLYQEIETEQKRIASLNEERSPIASEVRKVEAEVGPIKYIAHLLYGENPDANVLEKAVIWVTVLIVIVLDPLAVVLLLASQYSFQRFQTLDEEKFQEWTDRDFDELSKDAWVADVGEKPTAEELAEIATEGDSPEKESDIVSTATVTEPAPHHPDTHPYLNQGFRFPEKWEHVGPLVATTTTGEAIVEEPTEPVRTVITGNRAVPRTKVFRSPIQPLTTITEDLVQEQLQDSHHTVTHMGNGYIEVDGQLYHEGSVPPHIQGYIQNEEQQESSVWSKVKKNEG